MQFWNAGMSMVPLADIFNHKAAVIALGGEYSIEQAQFAPTLACLPFACRTRRTVKPGITHACALTKLIPLA